jgi:hypothetical protein
MVPQVYRPISDMAFTRTVYLPLEGAVKHIEGE